MRQLDGERIVFWLMPFLAATWLLVFVAFPNFSAPLPASASAQAVADFYRDPANTDRIRWSMIVFNWFSIGIIPLLVLIVLQIRRMAHHTPIMAYCYFGCLTGGPTLFFTADLFWLVAAFRPERAPELTQMLNDIAWVSFTGQVGFLIAQCLFLSIAIWLDRRADPIFAGWVAWFNVAIAVLIAPAAFTATQLTGPISWDGFLSFTVRNSAIAAWLIVMPIVLYRTMQRERAQARAAS